jgi:uncharacterized protein (TIGR01244 family)
LLAPRVTVVLTLARLAVPDRLAMADIATIYNWLRIDDRVTTSGQPSEAQLVALADLGVSCVINLGLHTHEKALPDEAASVAALGMRYVHIPVDFQHPTEADFAAFCTAMAAAREEPVHVHCIANYRVSAFFYRYRRDVLGMDAAEARADLDRIWAPDPIWSEFIASRPSP